MDAHVLTLMWVSVWFAATVVLVVWAQCYLGSKTSWPWWIVPLGTYVSACIMLGLFRGWIAWGVGYLIALVLSSERFQNWRECRRYGKKIAADIGIKPNLFFTAIELALERTGAKGTSVNYFFAMSRSPAITRDEIYRAIMPGLVIGFDVLESRFGKRAGIEEAKAKIRPLVRQYCDTPPDWAQEVVSS
jgi:hypothetical protein